MAASPVNTVIEHLRQAGRTTDPAGRTDAQLLDAFLTRKDATSFEMLVRRHGPMVLGTCRRILGNHHDAEDAFQATFLVLIHKAASIRPRGMLANWLYGVASNTARKARAMNTRRQMRERQGTPMPEPETVPPDLWDDRQALLDQELTCLPDKYRLPIVLCDLEGKSIKEATQQLGWPQGTLAGRLARGRKLLARRLAGRGLFLPGAVAAALLPPKTPAAIVPNALVASTVQCAGALAAGQGMSALGISTKVAALTKGVLQAMLLTKLKTLLTGLVILLFLLGAGAWAYQALAAPEREAPQPGKAAQSPPFSRTGRSQRLAVLQGKKLTADPVKKVAAKTDQEQWQGTWRIVTVQRYGRTWKVKENGDLVPQDKTPTAFPIAVEIPSRLVFSAHQLVEEYPQDGDSTLVVRWTYRLDGGKKPKRIIISSKDGKKVYGIYAFEPGSPRICWNIAYGQRRQEVPSGFDTKKNLEGGMDTELWILKRHKN